MNDDWRLLIEAGEAVRAEELVKQLQAPELEHDLDAAFADRLILSRDGADVFLYAGSRDQAERARDAVLDLARRNGWQLEPQLTHWHPAAEEWEDPDKPLPEGDAAALSEHEELIARERQETEERGYPEFEVRVDLPSHRDAAELAKRLRGEGLPSVHRWRFLLIGATDEDGAKELATRIESEAPAGSTVKVEGTWAAVYKERPPNPFAFMGGLGA
jgi:hypothetical protein